MASDLKSLSPKSGSRKAQQAYDKKGSSWVNILVWFLVVSILSYIILYTINPSYLQKKDANGNRTGVSDPWMTIIASLIIGLIVALIIYFVQRK